MKFTTVTLSAALSASALAYPGMQSDFSEFSKRQSGSTLPPPALLAAGTSSAVQDIINCLDTTESCENLSENTYVKPGQPSDALCQQDTCCIWSYVADDLVALFSNADGTCTEAARASIRQGFHDAGAWSTTSGFGGADGSLLISTTELSRPENAGLQDINAIYKTLWAKYISFGVGAADLIQFGATVAAVVCPLGPRTRVWVGRADGNGDSPTGLLPSVDSDADTLISLFLNKTISASDLAALVGAHSTSEQNVVDPALPNAPQDSTPGVNDILFYSETLDTNAPPNVFKFPSDVALAADSRTSGSFEFFGTNAAGQAAWNDAFARAYIRLSILGVSNVDSLVECTEVLPNAVNSFVVPAPADLAPSGSITSSAPVGTGAPYGSNSSGIYPYGAGYTTQAYTAVVTYTVTVEGSVSYSFGHHLATTVCAVPTAVSKSVPQGYFGPPGSYSYKPLVTTVPALAYGSCVPKTVYETVTVY